jgi:hypothetical protein
MEMLRGVYIEPAKMLSMTSWGVVFDVWYLPDFEFGLQIHSMSRVLMRPTIAKMLTC